MDLLEKIYNDTEYEDVLEILDKKFEIDQEFKNYLYETDEEELEELYELYLK